MKTDNKEERDNDGKEGKWRYLSLRERIVLTGLSLHIDPFHLACVWDIMSMIISLQSTPRPFIKKKRKEEKENLNFSSSYLTSSQAPTLASP